MTNVNAQATQQLERLIAEIWANVLGTENAPTDQDFFDQAGGSSIQALELAGRLAEKLPFEASLVALFFENPTIGGFARAVADEAGPHNLALVPQQPSPTFDKGTPQ